MNDERRTLVENRPVDEVEASIELCFCLLDRIKSSVSAQKGYDTEVPAALSEPTRTAQPSGDNGQVVAKPNRAKLRLPKTLSRTEVEQLMGVFNLKAPTGLRDRCMFELMYRAGLRVSEVCALEVRDVDLARGTIRVTDGKGGDGTAYFDSASVADLITRWKDRRKLLGVGKRAPLFCTLKGGPVSPTQLRDKAKRIARRAGIDPKKVTPHVLRHTFATELLDEGFNIRKVQEAVRHADLSTTMLYTHVLDSELRNEIQKRPRGEK